MATYGFHLIVNGQPPDEGGYRTLIITGDKTSDTHLANALHQRSEPANYLLNAYNSQGVVLCQSTGDDPWNVLVTTSLRPGTRRFIMTSRLGAPQINWSEVMLCLPHLYGLLEQIEQPAEQMILSPRQIAVEKYGRNTSVSLLEDQKPIELHPVNDESWWQEHRAHISLLIPCLLTVSNVSITDVGPIEAQLTLISSISSLLPAACRPMLTFSSHADNSAKEGAVRILFKRPSNLKSPIFNWASCEFRGNWHADEELPLPIEYRTALRSYDGQKRLREEFATATTLTTANFLSPNHNSLYWSFLHHYHGGQHVREIVDELQQLPLDGNNVQVRRRAIRVLDILAEQPGLQSNRIIVAQLNWKIVAGSGSDLQERIAQHPDLLRLQADEFAHNPKVLYDTLQDRSADNVSVFAQCLGQQFWTVTNLVNSLTKYYVTTSSDPGRLLHLLSHQKMISDKVHIDAIEHWLQVSGTKSVAVQALRYICNKTFDALEKADLSLAEKTLPQTAQMWRALNGKSQAILTIDDISEEINDPDVINKLEAFIRVHYKRGDICRYSTLYRELMSGEAKSGPALQLLQQRSTNLNRAQVIGIYRHLSQPQYGSDDRMHFAERLIRLSFEYRDPELLFDLLWDDYGIWALEVKNAISNRLQQGGADSSASWDPLSEFCSIVSNLSYESKDTPHKLSAGGLLLATAVEQLHSQADGNEVETIERCYDFLTHVTTTDAIERIDFLLDKTTSKSLQQKLCGQDGAPEQWHKFLDEIADTSVWVLFASDPDDPSNIAFTLQHLANLYKKTKRSQDLKRLIEAKVQNMRREPTWQPSPATNKVKEEMKKNGHRNIARSIPVPAASEADTAARLSKSQLSWVMALNLMFLLGGFVTLYLVLNQSIVGLVDEQHALATRIGSLEQSLASATLVPELAVTPELSAKPHTTASPNPVAAITYTATLLPSATYPVAEASGLITATNAATGPNPSLLTEPPQQSTPPTPSATSESVPINTSATEALSQTVLVASGGSIAVQVPTMSAPYSNTVVPRKASAILPTVTTAEAPNGPVEANKPRTGDLVTLAAPYILRTSDTNSEQISIQGQCSIVNIVLVRGDEWAALRCENMPIDGWRLLQDLSSIKP